MVQGLRLCITRARGLGSIPGQGLDTLAATEDPAMLQLRPGITKFINKYFFKG